MNKQFEGFLSNFHILEKYIEPVKDEFLDSMKQSEGMNKESETVLKGRLTEVNSKIEKLEERFILSDIEKDFQTKFSGAQ